MKLSPTSFHDVELPARIAHILQHKALAASDLTVEITEDLLLDAERITLRTPRELHALGVRLSMEDSGTGHSRLSQLRQLPSSELKRDRSFARDIEGDSIASALTRAITHIGQRLPLKVVAEGVESRAQMQLLGQQGYQIAEGFHFAPARPPTALAQWAREHLAETAPPVLTR